MSSEASIEAFNDVGSANVPLRIRGTDIKFFSSSTERVRITSGGDVNIKGEISVGLDSATLDFTDSNSNTNLLRLVQVGVMHFS